MQEFNYVGIDPSLISTAVSVNGKLLNYCREKDVYVKNGMEKWHKMCDGLVEYKIVEYRKFSSYSEGEIIKLNDYDKITTSIVEDIKEMLNLEISTKIGLEGYSYGSGVGAIVDLVTFSTLLRKKLYDGISKDITILSPAALKLASCKMSYKPVEVETGVKKKKISIEHRNNEGLAGGKFTKREMFLSLVENETWCDEWVNHLRTIKEDILANKTVKKPYEDVNDASLIERFLRWQV